MDRPRKPTLALVAATAVASLLSGCATTRPIVPQVAAGIDFSQAETLQVRLSNFDYNPKEIRLQGGRAYALNLTNVGTAPHTFTAPQFFAAARVQPAEASVIADGEVELRPGEKAVVHLVPARGTYDLVCTVTGHALMGMKGGIVVY